MIHSIKLPSLIIVGLITLFMSLKVAANETTGTTNDSAQSIRMISVTGHAERQLPPDLAHITVATEHRGVQLDSVRAQVNETTSKVLRALQLLRIPNSDVNSSSITIRPEFTYERAGARRFEGYTVNRQIKVTLRDLSNLGAVIERALAAGANQVSEPVFDHSDRANIERSVLAAGTQAARLNAIAAAKGVDMYVGVPFKITVHDGAATPQISNLRMTALESGTPEASYQPGLLTFRVTVSVDFELTTSDH